MLHALAAEEFRKANTVETLADNFAAIRNGKFDFGVTLAVTPQFSELPTIDDSGMLRLTGYYLTLPRVTYDFGFRFVEGRWRPLAFGVGITPPPPPGAAPAQKGAAAAAAKKAAAPADKKSSKECHYSLGTQAGNFIVTPPGWRPGLREKLVEEFKLPKDIQRIEAPTRACVATAKHDDASSRELRHHRFDRPKVR